MSLIDRATNDMLIGPDWAMNLEICDILNNDPGQIKDFVKSLKKRIGHRNPKVQLLALTLLETLIKNCSDIVHMHVAERDTPHEMAKIVKKKPDFHVKEKILVLIDTWQEAFGGPRARYPQYYAAYQELLRHGVVFPKRPDRVVPIFTPPQTRALLSNHQSSLSPSYRPKGKGFSDGCDLPTMSFSDMQNARGIMGVLLEMIDALDPENKEGIKQEVILDLVHQCRSYREKLVHLVNSTSDEDLLCEGLALNDDLQEVVAKYDAIAAGAVIRAKKPKTLQSLVDVDNSADTNKDGRPNTNTSTQQLLLPAPPTPSRGNPQFDLLSGDFDTPASENPLALVPVSEQMANSAKEQNMFSLSDMFSQSSDVSSNSSPRTPCHPFSANSATQAYPSTSQASPYSNGPSLLWLPQYEQSSYRQAGHLNHGSPNSQAASNINSQEQPLDGVHDEGLPPPPWEAQPMESHFPGGVTYPQMMQSGQFQRMHPGPMQGNHAMYYSSGFETNQHTAYYPSSMLPGVYSQQMQGGHPTSYVSYPQQLQGNHIYDQRPCYPSYTDANDISQGMRGLSMQESSTYTNVGPSYQMPTSPYSQQRIMPSKSEDKLFGDLVNIAKSKQDKPTVG